MRVHPLFWLSRHCLHRKPFLSREQANKTSFIVVFLFHIQFFFNTIIYTSNNGRPAAVLPQEQNDPITFVIHIYLTLPCMKYRIEEYWGIVFLRGGTCQLELEQSRWTTNLFLSLRYTRFYWDRIWFWYMLSTRNNTTFFFFTILNMCGIRLVICRA